MEVSEIGVPPSHPPLFVRIFHEINHPAIGGTLIYGNPYTVSLPEGKSHIIPLFTIVNPL